MSFDLVNKIKVLNPHANIDELYGPYDSIVAAREAIPIALRILGRTVGIIESGSVVEYWFRDNTTTLIKKNEGGPGSGEENTIEGITLNGIEQVPDENKIVHLEVENEAGGEQENINRHITFTHSDIGATGEETKEELADLVATYINSLEITQEGEDNYYFELIKQTTGNYNFDITADWANNGVTDQASFESLLANKDLSNITITDFVLDGNSLKCNLTADCPNNELYFDSMYITEVKSIGNINSLQYLYLDSNQIVDFNPDNLPSSLQDLYLSSNQITNFNPDNLPSSLQYLLLYSNQITDFNPDNLPISLLTLDLSNNQISNFNPDNLPSSLQTLGLGYNQIVDFNPDNLPSSLLTLDLRVNQITDFNPDNLPSSLQYLYLNSNQISDWSLLEPFANNIHSVVDGIIYTRGNSTSVGGTTFKTILESKGWTVNL